MMMMIVKVMGGAAVTWHAMHTLRRRWSRSKAADTDTTSAAARQATPGCSALSCRSGRTVKGGASGQYRYRYRAAWSYRLATRITASPPGDFYYVCVSFRASISLSLSLSPSFSLSFSVHGCRLYRRIAGSLISKYRVSPISIPIPILLSIDTR